MGAPKRHTRNTDTPPDLSHETIRSLWLQAKRHYQHYAHAAERVDEQIRLVIAGQRANLRRLRHAIDLRDHHYADLQPVLQEIARRVEHSGKRPPADLDTAHGFLTTQAQAIAAAATREKFEL